jgi:hypothetical protein
MAQVSARIAIVGGGELGGLLAHVLARRNVAPEICLVDDNGRAAQGKSLDISQAAPVEGFASNVSGSADLITVAGSTIVAIAAPFGNHDRQEDAAMLLLKRVRDLSPASLIVCAGAADCDLIGRAVRELHLPRTAVLGSAPAGGRCARPGRAGTERRPERCLLGSASAASHRRAVGGRHRQRVFAGAAAPEPARRRLDSRVACGRPGPTPWRPPRPGDRHFCAVRSGC